MQVNDFQMLLCAFRCVGKFLDVNLRHSSANTFPPLNRRSEHFGSKATQAFGDGIIANEVSPCHRGEI